MIIQRIQPFSAVFWSVGAVLLAACGLPEPQFIGEHVQIAVDSDLQICGDGAAHMDRFVRLLADELGMPAPTGADRLEFFWLTGDDWPSRTGCRSFFVGCTRAGVAYSTGAPLDHELVHALVWEFGRTAPFFSEGLATAYELPWPGTMREHSIEVLAAVASQRNRLLDSWAYGTAAMFTAYLIERFGIAAYLRVYRRLSPRDGTAQISRALQAELGVSLETLAADYSEARHTCSYDAARPKLFECSAPEIAWDGEIWTHHRTLDCDQDDVIGPFAGDTVAVYHTLEITTPGLYQVQVVGDAAGQGGNAVELMRCGGCDDYAELRAFAGEPSDLGTYLSAGRYAVRLQGPATQATSIGIRLERKS